MLCVLQVMRGTASPAQEEVLVSTINEIALLGPESGWDGEQLQAWDEFLYWWTVGVDQTYSDWDDILTTLGFSVDYSDAKLSVPALTSAVYDAQGIWLTFDVETDRATYLDSWFYCDSILTAATVAHLEEYAGHTHVFSSDDDRRVPTRREQRGEANPEHDEAVGGEHQRRLELIEPRRQ